MGKRFDQNIYGCMKFPNSIKGRYKSLHLGVKEVILRKIHQLAKYCIS